MRQEIRNILSEISNSTMDRPDFIYPNYELEIDNNEFITVDLYIETLEPFNDTLNEAWIYKTVDSITKKEIFAEDTPEWFQKLLDDPNFAPQLIEEMLPDPDDYVDDLY